MLATFVVRKCMSQQPLVMSQGGYRLLLCDNNSILVVSLMIPPNAKKLKLWILAGFMDRQAKLWKSELYFFFLAMCFYVTVDQDSLLKAQNPKAALYRLCPGSWIVK